MELWICQTCGTQFPASEAPPQNCPICGDERQYIGHNGQQWTTLAQMKDSGYRNTFKEHEPGLIGIGSEPHFAIGQRALLVQTEAGNVLWDCITYLDNETIEGVQRLGGIKAIAISHPHYYSCMVEWAEAFNVPIYLHEADRQWVMRASDHITFWTGETQSLPDGLTLIRTGGHFSGSAVLHWPSAADKKGVLLTGDTISVVVDRHWVSFMYSYPNLIPLPATEVQRIRETVAPFRYERLYGAWFETIVASDAQNVVQRSAARYITALGK